jgi:hypothetical protein
MWERGWGSIGGEEAVEGFGGGAVDGCYDEIARVGLVLQKVLVGEYCEAGKGEVTLPLLDSTDAAFFLLSVTSAPATVVTTVLGGRCRRPGPNFSVFLFPVPVGSTCAGISSPGRTSVAIVVESDCQSNVGADVVNVGRTWVSSCRGPCTVHVSNFFAGP